MTHWQNILSGILGLWIILLVFLGFSSTLTTFFLIVTGLGIAGLGFWSASLIKPVPKNPPESEISPTSPASPPASPSLGGNRGEPEEQTPENDNSPEIPSQNNAPQDF